MKNTHKEEPYFGSKEANQKRYKEIREDVKRILSKHDRKEKRWTEEQLLAVINQGGGKKRGHRDRAYERKVQKRNWKNRRRR